MINYNILKNDLLSIKNIDKIDFDLCAAELDQVIFCARFMYSYFEYCDIKAQAKKDIIDICKKYNLKKSIDPIEDYGGGWLYFVFDMEAA